MLDVKWVPKAKNTSEVKEWLLERMTKAKKTATSSIKRRLRTPKHSAIQVTLTPETKLQVQCETLS